MNNFPVTHFKDVVFDEIIYKLQNDAIDGIHIYSVDLENDWSSFLQHLKVVSAAGGLVLNDQKEVLFIYRNNIWDLPKGRIEKGESIETAAIREVEEECGIFNLAIEKKLLITYHIYFQNGIRLKETHWFLMTSNYKGDLKPQLEEGITEVVFKNEHQTKKALQNTYANIKLVYDTFKDV